MGLTGSPYIHPTDAPDSVGGTLRLSVANGAASGTDIAVSAGGHAISPDDKVVAIHQFAAGVLSDRTAHLSMIKAGAIQLSGASSSGDQLQVHWLDLLPG